MTGKLLVLDTPPGVRFTCSRCGDCCRDSNIRLRPGERERLQALDWRGVAPDLVDVPVAVAVEGAGGGALRLPRRDDGACIYLGDDNACRIHQQFGGDAKPLMCRLYPFGLHPVGKRVAVDCSYSCSAVSRGEGAPVEDHAPELRSLVERELGQPVPVEHRLNERYALSDEVLAELNEHLLELLDGSGLSLFDRIRCLLQFARLATTGDPQSAVAGKLRSAIIKGLPRQIVAMPWQGHMDKTQRAIFFQWLYLSLNPALPNQDLLSKKERRREEQRRIEQGDRYRKGGRVVVDNRELALDFEQTSAVDGSFVEKGGARIFQTYLTAKIASYRYLTAGEDHLVFTEGLSKFLLVYPMTIWTAQALAADRAAAAVEEIDLRRALRLLDRSLGQLSTARLPRKQRQACDFVMLESDVVVAARNELLGLGPADPDAN